MASALKILLEKRAGKLRDFIDGSKAIGKVITDLGGSLNKNISTEEIKELQKKSFNKGLLIGSSSVAGLGLAGYGVKKLIDKKKEQDYNFNN